MVWLTDARAPEGMRIYAIGDVHGCLDALQTVHRAIEADLDARPVADWRIVHLGDYVDRGSDSRGVIEHLIGCAGRQPSMLFLRGNHDQMFLQAVHGDRRAAQMWLNNGGTETLESYGTDVPGFIDALRDDRATELFPRSHLDFLESLGSWQWLGDYFFVHAGIDPALPLEGQPEEALLWIRGPFLDCTAEFDAVVVHGHTPVTRVEVRQNRIGIDTGAVFGGTLACLVLDGGDRGLLVGQWIDPLPVRAPRDLGSARSSSGVLSRVLRGRLPIRFGRRG